MNSQSPCRSRTCRSRPEIGLIVLYLAVATALFASIGVGLAMTGGAGTVINPADMHRIDVASR